MINFEASNLEDLQNEVLVQKHKVAIGIVESICTALDNDINTTEVDIIAGGDITISAVREDFQNALQFNIGRCEESEEYELCDRATRWIERLS